MYICTYIVCEHMLATLPCSFAVNNTILYPEIVEWLVQGLNARRAASCTLGHNGMPPVHNTLYVQVYLAAVFISQTEHSVCTQ